MECAFAASTLPNRQSSGSACPRMCLQNAPMGVKYDLLAAQRPLENVAGAGGSWPRRPPQVHRCRLGWCGAIIRVNAQSRASSAGWRDRPNHRRVVRRRYPSISRTCLNHPGQGEAGDRLAVGRRLFCATSAHQSLSERSASCANGKDFRSGVGASAAQGCCVR